jgi:hypothetical protein
MGEETDAQQAPDNEEQTETTGQPDPNEPGTDGPDTGDTSGDGDADGDGPPDDGSIYTG